MIYLDILKKVDPSQIEIYEKFANLALLTPPFDIRGFINESNDINESCDRDENNILWWYPKQPRKIDPNAIREELAMEFAQEFWKKHYKELGCKPYEYVLFCEPITMARIAKYDGMTKKEYEDGMEGNLFQIPELIAAELLVPESHFISFDNSKDTDEFLANWFHIPIPFLNMRRLALQIKDFE